MDRKRPLILNCSPFDSRSWKWFDGRVEADFWHVDSWPHNSLEQLVTRPALSRYRAAVEAGWKSRNVDLLITHSPDLTCWTELFRRSFGIRTPHLAFAFNFTRLPEGLLLASMKRAFQSVDRIIVFSTFERELYSKAFGVPVSRFEMIFWGVGNPQIGSLPPGLGGDYICAVGGEGRDYTTFLAAMRKLPHIRAEVVARPHNIGTTHIPANVTVRTNIPPGQANAIIRHSRFMVLPLLHSEVPCGHVTMVSAMQLGKPLVITDSRGIADYVATDRTALLCRPGDPEEMAFCITKLWNDSQKSEAMGAAAQEFAERNFTEQSTVNQLARCIAEMTPG